MHRKGKEIIRTPGKVIRNHTLTIYLKVPIIYVIRKYTYIA